MKLQLLKELTSTLNENEKSLEGVMKYFELGDKDTKWQHYDIKTNFDAYWKMERVLTISISLGEQSYAIQTEGRGHMKATKDAIANLDVYKLTQVY